jgi:alcohol dehydrogenase class IV
MVSSFNNFSFSPFPSIYFGAGSIHQLARITNNSNERVLLVTGKSSFEQHAVGSTIQSILKSNKLKYHCYQISGEPSPSVIDEAISTFTAKKISTVIAVGGGSVMDSGKAVAAMFCQKGSVKDYLEGVGIKEPSGKRIKLIAIPTTSGTGSEATKNAVISEFGPTGFKKSLRHDNYVPDIAIIDPVLMLGCPPDITAYSGMDAFTQLLESYISTKSNPLTDALAISGLERIAKSLKKAFENGNDLESRSDMAYAALLSGITLANAGLGLVHGFAQPLGSLFTIPHGIVCGTMMPVVNRLTVSKLRSSKKNEEVLNKYSSIGILFSKGKGRNQDFYIDLLIEIIDEYSDLFKIPKLSLFGVKEENFKEIIEKVEMKNHPVSTTNDELVKILIERL